MIIYIGADHRGFALKEKLKTQLLSGGHEVVDAGDVQYVPGDDYPAFAAAVAKNVAEGVAGDVRGIVICGSGFGVDIVANKVHGVRSALASSAEHIRAGRNDDDVNVLALAADLVDETAAIAMVKIFLETPFANDEKYSRRLGEIKEIERTN